jgi:hypothetical protein
MGRARGGVCWGWVLRFAEFGDEEKAKVRGAGGSGRDGNRREVLRRGAPLDDCQMRVSGGSCVGEEADRQEWRKRRKQKRSQRQRQRSGTLTQRKAEKGWRARREPRKLRVASALRARRFGVAFDLGKAVASHRTPKVLGARRFDDGSMPGGVESKLAALAENTNAKSAAPGKTDWGIWR